MSRSVKDRHLCDWLTKTLSGLLTGSIYIGEPQPGNQIAFSWSPLASE